MLFVQHLTRLAKEFAAKMACRRRFLALGARIFGEDSRESKADDIIHFFVYDAYHLQVHVPVNRELLMECIPGTVWDGIADVKAPLAVDNGI